LTYQFLVGKNVLMVWTAQ